MPPQVLNNLLQHLQCYLRPLAACKAVSRLVNLVTHPRGAGAVGGSQQQHQRHRMVGRQQQQQQVRGYFCRVVKRAGDLAFSHNKLHAAFGRL